MKSNNKLQLKVLLKDNFPDNFIKYLKDEIGTNNCKYHCAKYIPDDKKNNLSIGPMIKLMLRYLSDKTEFMDNDSDSDNYDIP